MVIVVARLMPVIRGCAILARPNNHPFWSNSPINALRAFRTREERHLILREAACAENVRVRDSSGFLQGIRLPELT
jgi:hypothetical protein